MEDHRKRSRSRRSAPASHDSAWRVFPTPLGSFTVEYRERGVTRVLLPGQQPRPPAATGPCPAFLVDLERELDRYFAGQRVAFTVPLLLEGMTPFQTRVLEECRGIGHGEVRTYGWLATRAGRPGAARAVGQVMARNPVPLLIPCHRVVAAGGGLGGFGGGLALKARLLAIEGR
ncbi:MAG: methylated-DNA--[protein]-cysteine S-methyltransferase [bacterium]|nr:methylated-DNA--[protein]-cysteine S-methyltransferase [bacterium]